MRQQVTEPRARVQPTQTVQADKAAFKSLMALEPLPGSTAGSSTALGNNDLGQVVGQSTSSDGIRAVIWDHSTVPQDLGVLPGDTYSLAQAISNDGRVIAGFSYGGIPTTRFAGSSRTANG